MADRWALFLVAALVAQPALADEKSAAAAEDRAFTAVEEERWCDAVHGFLEANEAAPSVDLIFNAALAADEAGDRKEALKLYVELLGAYPDSDRGEAVNTRIGELTKLVQKEGPGTACPEPVAPEPEPEPEPEPAPEVTEPGDGAESGAALGAVVPWTVAGLGVALAVVGVGVTGVGAWPYADFLSARDAILVAEAEGGDAGPLQEQQAAARAAWQGWGEPLVWTGAVTTVVGVTVGGAGVVWALVAGGEE